MYVQTLKLENWKNFRSPGSVTLAKRVFLVGPNASGKSNFLDVFRFLRDLCLPGGGFQRAVNTRGGVSAIRCLAARKYPDVSIDVTLADDSVDAPCEWRYLLEFTQDNNRRPIIEKEVVECCGKTVLTRPSPEDKDDAERKTQTALEQITANKEFRPVASFFKGVAYQHLLPQVIRDPSNFSSGPVTDDPYGRDFLQRVASTLEKTRKSRLKKILAALKVAVPQLSDLQVRRDEKTGTPHLVGAYDHWRPHASHQNEAQFSDGTLRLFGVLWTLFEGNGLLLMEEPELSLHVEIVRRLPQLIAAIQRFRKVKRQVLISTHSHELVGDESISADEVLWLEPSNNGTLIRCPANDEEERTLLESGLSVADVVMPRTAPREVQQLMSFMES